MRAGQQMRTVLFVVSDVNADHTVGGERIRKFAKFLPEFGFDVCFLAAQQLGANLNVSGDKVYRAFEPGHIYRPLVRRLSRIRDEGPHASAEAIAASRLAPVRRWLLDNLLIP